MTYMFVVNTDNPVHRYPIFFRGIPTPLNVFLAIGSTVKFFATNFILKYDIPELESMFS